MTSSVDHDAKAPMHWYKHKARDLALNRNYQNLGLDELGLLLRIRDETFLHDGLPADIPTMAAYLNLPEDVLEKARTKRLMDFCAETQDGRLVCIEVLELKMQAAAAYDLYRRNGRKGADAKKARRRAFPGARSHAEDFESSQPGSAPGGDRGPLP